MSTDDILEIADYLRKLNTADNTLVRFDEIAKDRNLSLDSVSANFAAAAEKAELDIIEQTDARATVRRRSRMGRMHTMDIDS